MTRPLIIYHDNCLDGFTAAWAVSKIYEHGCELLPVSYGKPPPNVVGRDVFIVDFSYPHNDLVKMYRDSSTMILMDHHKSAEQDLKDLIGCWCTFDMNRSGAGIAWDKMHGADCRPWLVNYVEDRDLWRHSLPNSKEIMAYLSTVDMTLENWDKLEKTDPKTFIAMGRALIKKTELYCKAMSSFAKMGLIDDRECIWINAPPPMISDLLNFLCKERIEKTGNENQMALGWHERADGYYGVSLRSTGDIDVSEIAKEYGGGGHKHAAGYVSKYLIPG